MVETGKLLNQLIKDNEPENVAECLAIGLRVVFTYYQKRMSSHARLDGAYVAREIVPYCRDYAVHFVSFSDHS